MMRLRFTHTLCCRLTKTAVMTWISKWFLTEWTVPFYSRLQMVSSPPLPVHIMPVYALLSHKCTHLMSEPISQVSFLVVPVLLCDAGVVPDMSPAASTSSHMFPVGSDSAYEQTFSMLQASFMNPDVQPSSCLNPYCASYDQELLPCAFTKRGLSGQDQRAPSHFIPTSSNTAMVPTSQVQQGSHSLRPGSAASYSIPKDVLHVGEDKPMAREARVARCVCCLT